MFLQCVIYTSPHLVQQRRSCKKSTKVYVPTRRHINLQAKNLWVWLTWLLKLILNMFVKIQRDNLDDNIKAYQCGDPALWRLASDNGGELEESVFRLQGIICSKELPPYNKWVNTEQRTRSWQPSTDYSRLPVQETRIKYFQQAVQLTAFGMKEFDVVLENIRHFQMRFIRHFGDMTVVEWEPTSFRDEFSTVTASNRLFSMRSSGSNAESDDALRSIDPTGRLRTSAAKLGLHHTGENKVEYFAFKEKENIQR